MQLAGPRKERLVAAVVAPSGPFDANLLNEGRARLAPYVDFVVPRDLAERRVGFLAGSDDERFVELERALASDADLVWFARGGYGLGRILARLDARTFGKNWVIGFSDATALHLALARRGVRSLHAPNLTTVARLDAVDFDRLVDVLAACAKDGGPRPESTRPTSTEPSPVLLPLRRLGAARPHDRITGPLVGGNLTVLFTEAAAGRLALPEGAILFLEDVTETSYRVDRMLSALLDGGHFRSLGALLLGDFTDCSPGKFDVPVEEVLDERLGRLPCPTYAGLPVGHGARHWTLLHGAPATLETNGTLALL